ncbi:ATP-dependent DNA ligase [Carbonactinospora thermoautotrophica]|uniref:ATP-dependent DNA ligase n=1 Tax=Carbonactinospora thermoautotrophica TaxID=1469144 RepID=UPI0022707F22|nr:ATP-dependent DNA ligase [Carbonactinospora thermoautotrophica]MCX9190686.1 ATP-dependent DNA ligase [Carbonactinospora thermoautotrophica]
MRLPVMPPVRPMRARPVPSLPPPDSHPAGLVYEPRWDGLRCLVFRDRDEVELGSRRSLTRYFPEVVQAAREALPERCVVDGVIVVRSGARLDFGALANRIHPAASRIRRLAAQTPAWFIAFDLLALGEEGLLEVPFGERRRRLVEALGRAGDPVYVAPATTDYGTARRWLEVFEDGVVAKPRDVPYRPDERVLYEVRHERTADCVIAGYRWHRQVVGSLLLGLFAEDGRLWHVGVADGFSMIRRRELVEELSGYRLHDGEEHPWAGWENPERHAGEDPPDALPGPERDLPWTPVRPELVCEVAYDRLEGRRFRQAARFRRLRPDRDARSCTYAQLARPVRFDVAKLLVTGRVDGS